jgi:hypothetical protein
MAMDDEMKDGMETTNTRQITIWVKMLPPHSYQRRDSKTFLDDRALLRRLYFCTRLTLQIRVYGDVDTE